MKYILSFCYIICSILGLTLLKLGAIKDSFVFIKIGKAEINGLSMAGCFFYGISFFLYTIVISKFDLSYIAPVMGGIINTLAVLIGIKLFHEQVNTISMIGCVLIIGGLVFMNIKK